MNEWKTKQGTKIIQVLSGRSNSFLIKTLHYNILVDTGKSSSYRKLLLKLKIHIPTNAQLDFLILTHTHFDHCQNASLIKEKFNSTVLLSEYDREFVKRGYSPLPEGANIVTRIISIMGNKIFRKKCSFSSFTPDIAIRNYFEITDHNSNIGIVSTEGHSRGSISVIIDNEIAIVGDVLFGVFRKSVLPPFFNDRDKLTESWKTLLNTGCQLFLPGHGRAIKRLRLAIEYNKYSFHILKNA